MRKPKPRVRVAKTVSAPTVVAAPIKEPWFRALLTDHNGDWDFGAWLVAVVTIFMCANSWYDVHILHNKFDAQAFGAGIAAMLVGFAAYKYGDAKRPPGMSVTTTTTAAATPLSQ